VFLVFTVFFLLFCRFMVASSMGLCLSGNREINMMMMMTDGQTDGRHFQSMRYVYASDGDQLNMEHD